MALGVAGVLEDAERCSTQVVETPGRELVRVLFLGQKSVELIREGTRRGRHEYKWAKLRQVPFEENPEIVRRRPT
ncbi:MAG TPA: hypothetical protein VMK12_14820 [Anaeromyxobacteraceae bacterium]|nr:hypothetical protein [Anaeromyxobacteraceae bacterium]